MRILLLLLLSFNAYADELLTWTPPTHRENNDLLPSSEIAGYRIFCYQKGMLALKVDVANVTAHTVTLPAGKYGCEIITIDTDGLKSARSNPARFTIPGSNPNPPVLQ